MNLLATKSVLAELAEGDVTFREFKIYSDALEAMLFEYELLIREYGIDIEDKFSCGIEIDKAYVITKNCDFKLWIYELTGPEVHQFQNRKIRKTDAPFVAEI